MKGLGMISSFLILYSRPIDVPTSKEAPLIRVLERDLSFEIARQDCQRSTET